jgi:uncharacterized protein YbbC (DUF1343 family)
MKLAVAEIYMRFHMEMASGFQMAVDDPFDLIFRQVNTQFFILEVGTDVSSEPRTYRRSLDF